MAVTRTGPRRDIRIRAIALTIAAVVAGGALIHRVLTPDAGPAATATPARTDPRSDPAGHAAESREREIALRFQQAAMMLHAGQHEHAIAALHRLLDLAPRMPEAHVNMGFALAGLKRHAAARDFFASAIELNPMQANAYYGLALAADELGDRPAAVGAMRSYLHLARKEDPRHLSKARAALWEWETQAATPPATAASRPAGNRRP
jgi:tetratricopeptide (TPR) repeat protein